MANPDYPYGFKPYAVQGFGGAVPMDTGSLAVSQTIHKGDALIRDANGYLSIALAASTAIVGVAAEDKTTDASTHEDLLYYPATEQTLFVGQCSGTLTQAVLGTSVDIEGGTGVMEINEDATTTGVARLIRMHPDSAMGANAQVIFSWNKSQYTGQA